MTSPTNFRCLHCHTIQQALRAPPHHQLERQVTPRYYIKINIETRTREISYVHVECFYFLFK